MSNITNTMGHQVEPQKNENEAQPASRGPGKRFSFHPRRHGHVAIQPAETRVRYLDPGVVTFS